MKDKDRGRDQDVHDLLRQPFMIHAPETTAIIAIQPISPTTSTATPSTHNLVSGPEIHRKQGTVILICSATRNLHAVFPCRQGSRPEVEGTAWRQVRACTLLRISEDVRQLAVLTCLTTLMIWCLESRDHFQRRGMRIGIGTNLWRVMGGE